MNREEIDDRWENITPELLEQFRSNTLAIIDEELKRIGFNNIDEITDDEGFRHVKKGSSPGKVGMIIDSGHPLYIVEAEVMTLPSDKELILPLMRELLERNHYIPGEQRFGIDNEKVTLKAVVPGRLIRKGDIARIFHNVMFMADEFDDKLQQKYSGTTITRGEDDDNGLCIYVDEKDPFGAVFICGKIDAQTGDFILVGVESGQMTEQQYGQKEHKYSIVIPASQKPLLLNELDKMIPDAPKNELYDDDSLCDAIGALFVGDKQLIYKVKSLCQKAQINFS